MRHALKFALLATSLLTATTVNAAWPERPVTIVVPFTAGGITDVLARLTAERLHAAFKQPFVVENQAGAAGVIAANRVAKANGDGNTLIFTPAFQITMAPFTHQVTFDPIRDFKPVSAVAASPFVITTNSAVPANTLADFIAYVKSKPGQLTFGSAGTGSLTHVSSAVFLKSAGLKMVHVPYRGVASALTDLLAGHIAMLSASPVELKPYLESGMLKPLAVTGEKRSVQLPNVPTIAETLESPPVVTYNGLLAPGRTPDDLVATIAREITGNSDLLARLEKAGVEPMASTPQEFARVIAADSEFWRDMVRELNLKSP
jgi:tripartite-type tricarboxylate transporter receptor subunit TctC